MLSPQKHLALQHGGPLQDEGLAKRSGPDVILLPDVLQDFRPLQQRHNRKSQVGDNPDSFPP